MIDRKENFRKIIDHKNNSGWIHWTQLKNSISLITTSEKILFEKPTKFSKPLAKLDGAPARVGIEKNKQKQIS